LIESVLRDFPRIAFLEVDMVAEQKRAVALGIRMSPTWVFDDKIIAVGIPAGETLRMLLEELIHDKTH
jgi:predicted DsbA family dithiol-disulfide isomerase